MVVKFTRKYRVLDKKSIFNQGKNVVWRKKIYKRLNTGLEALL